ncbi:MAG: TlyA family RNA methyltransferase [Lachnospiraceae bacterium]|nr:TlyA family RNA methyltransferase [Lachnospiraceae bacterium]
MGKRIDVYMTESLGIKSRSKAQELIRGGFVYCNGKQVTKTGQLVLEKDLITISENEVLKYVSRGGLKLEGAIREFGLDFKDKVILDIGSSTGGFTDCALKHGAAKIIAVDVGTDIMDEKLKSDPRVELHEKTDIRDFEEENYSDIDYAVCDASFISLPIALKNLGNSKHDFMLMALIKPQFECGPKLAAKYKGVITDDLIRIEVVNRVIRDMENIGFRYIKHIASPIKGGDGNTEYLSLFEHKVY